MKKKGRNDKNELLGILKNPTFMLSTFTRASVSFIFDITHLFIKDYVQKGLGETNQILLLSYYSIASGFGPSIGGQLVVRLLLMLKDISIKIHVRLFLYLVFVF